MTEPPVAAAGDVEPHQHDDRVQHHAPEQDADDALHVTGAANRAGQHDRHDERLGECIEDVVEAVTGDERAGNRQHRASRESEHPRHRSAGDPLPPAGRLIIEREKEDREQTRHDRGSDDVQRWKQLVHATDGRKNEAGGAQKEQVPLSILSGRRWLRRKARRWPPAKCRDVPDSNRASVTHGSSEIHYEAFSAAGAVCRRG
jgi:hypothetical protein